MSVVSHIKRGTQIWVFDNGMPMRIFGPEREEVAEGWKKFHEQIHKLYSSSNIIRVIKSGG
jgi:hypothetical protein